MYDPLRLVIRELEVDSPLVKEQSKGSNKKIQAKHLRTQTCYC